MERSETGRYEISLTVGGLVHAFVPVALPPKPKLDMAAMQGLAAQAHLALGRLDSLSTLLPDHRLLLYSYIRKEAELSSQIEGTQSSLSDLMMFEIDEAPGAPIDDVAEVSRCVAAFEHGLRRIRDGFPLSNELIREIHFKLLERGRGSDKSPGEFRRLQNWIGGTRPTNARFVPPPPHAVQDCMSDLERFLRSEYHDIPALIQAGLAHVQFETIHPFLDGNGRVGRLLIALTLCAAGVLREPMLYLSLYFMRRRQDYYELLNGVRENGDWETWIKFFLEGVRETAEGAYETARRLLDLFEADQARIQKIGRPSGSALRTHQALKERPVSSIRVIRDGTGLSFPAASSAINRLAELGIVREITGAERNRVFVYDRYLAILNEGTEPL